MIRSIILFMLALAFAHPAYAQSVSDMAKKFGSRSEVESISLSPDGSSIAYVRPNAGRGAGLYVARIGEATPPKRIFESAGSPWEISWCGWINNARLVCEVFGVLDRAGTLLGFTRLLAFNRDGSVVKQLGNERTLRSVAVSQFDGDLIGWSQDDSGNVLLARNYVPETSVGTRLSSTDKGLGVDLVNSETLDRRKLVSPNPVASSYVADTKGNVRLMGTEDFGASGRLSGLSIWYYRAAGESGWKKFSESRSDRDGLRPIAVDADSNTAYAWADKDGRWALYRVKLEGSLPQELVLAHDRVDLDSLVTIGRNGRVIGAQYVTEGRHTELFDAEYKALSARLTRALPGNPSISFVDASRDEDKLLIYVAAGNDPGRYYLYGKKAKSLNELLLVRPDLETVKLGATRPIKYKTADGTMVPAYLTMPPNLPEGRGLPAIVLPHGGPSARDELGFDWIVQYFASQGYAVLQPNFRGSAGYGDQWYQENGFKSWRTAISDVRDAGRWLISEGIADPKQLAAVGWSYGGYAALQVAAFEPGLYKASVAIAPVTDLRMLVAEKQNLTSGKLVAEFVGKGPHLEEGSPLQQAASISVPVLMFTGDRDINVHFSHAKEMDKKLKSLGKASTLHIYPGLDHQLPDGTVRSDMLLKTSTFLNAAFSGK